MGRALVWACALIGACASVEEQCERCGESSGTLPAAEESADSTGVPGSGSSESDDSLDAPEKTGSASSSDASTGVDGSCREADEPCSHGGECCIHPDGALVCVAGEDGASCQPSCERDDECATGCCVPLHGGGGACVDASECVHDCRPLDAECEADADCCDGTSCVANVCALACTAGDTCPSGTCDEASQCAPAEGCDDGSHFCSGGTTMFECDLEAWYGFDCTAACIEAGWLGSSGCTWSDLWEDGTCLCTDEVAE